MNLLKWLIMLITQLIQLLKYLFTLLKYLIEFLQFLIKLLNYLIQLLKQLLKLDWYDLMWHGLAWCGMENLILDDYKIELHNFGYFFDVPQHILNVPSPYCKYPSHHDLKLEKGHFLTVAGADIQKSTNPQEKPYQII